MINIKKIRRLNDYEVIWRVFDHWRPMGGGFIGWALDGDGLRLDEYDGYTDRTLQILKNFSNPYGLAAWFEEILFEKMGMTPTEEKRGECSYYAWCLTQAWRNHLQPDSNLRLIPDGEISFSSDQLNAASDCDFILTRYEILQQILEVWDPEKSTKAWLHGRNTLNSIDDTAIEIYSSIHKEITVAEIQNIMLKRFSRQGQFYSRYGKHFEVETLRYAQAIFNFVVVDLPVKHRIRRLRFV